MVQRQSAYFDEIEAGEGQNFLLWMKPTGAGKVKAFEVDEKGDATFSNVKVKDIYLQNCSLKEQLDAKNKEIVDIKAALAELMEWKNKTDQVVKNFQFINGKLHCGSMVSFDNRVYLHSPLIVQSFLYAQELESKWIKVGRFVQVSDGYKYTSD